MKKQGILFQGLPVFEKKQTACCLQEESGHYGDERISEKVGEYVDVTYFLVYAICQRESGRRVLEQMEEPRKEELIALAEKSEFQSGVFWQCLDREGQILGKCVVGLLEELRGNEEEKQELAWIGFQYLIHKGFPKEYAAWAYKANCSIHRGFSDEDGNLQTCSRICMNLLIAQELGVEILKDENYFLFCRCVKEWKEFWELSKGGMTLKFCQKLLKKNQKQGTIKLGRNWFYLCDVIQ